MQRLNEIGVSKHGVPRIANGCWSFVPIKVAIKSRLFGLSRMVRVHVFCPGYFIHLYASGRILQALSSPWLVPSFHTIRCTRFQFHHSQMICQFPSISHIRKVGCVDQTSKYLPQDSLVNWILLLTCQLRHVNSLTIINHH